MIIHKTVLVANRILRSTYSRLDYNTMGEKVNISFTLTTCEAMFKLNPIINIQQVQEQMNNGGCWLLNDASPPMKVYAQKHNLDVRQYRTPRKFIRQQDQIVVVSISMELWAGIKIYDEKDLSLRKSAGNISILAEKDSYKLIVSALDRYVDNEFIQEMIDTGYISREEYEFYSNYENQSTLTLIQTIVI